MKNIIEGFTPCPDEIVEKYGLVTAAVYGKVCRYESMKDKSCSASQARLAKELNLSVRTISTHMDNLVKCGYIEIISNEKGKTREYRTTDKLTLYMGVRKEMQTTPAIDAGLPLQELQTKIVVKDTKQDTKSKDSGKAAPPEPRLVDVGNEFEDPKPKTAKQKRVERDALLDHPALITYRRITHLNVDFTWRAKVAETVGDTDTQVKKWEQLIVDWIGNGWKKTNIKGMLEAFRSGGIKSRPNGQPAKSIDERISHL